MKAQIEKHGAPKACCLDVVTFGNNGLVTIRRQGSLDIVVSGNKFVLAEQLSRVIARLLEKGNGNGQTKDKHNSTRFQKNTTR